MIAFIAHHYCLVVIAYLLFGLLYSNLVWLAPYSESAVIKCIFFPLNPDEPFNNRFMQRIPHERWAYNLIGAIMWPVKITGDLVIHVIRVMIYLVALFDRSIFELARLIVRQMERRGRR